MAAAASSVGDPAGPPDLTGDQARRLLDAVVGVASDLSLPDVLRRIVDSATRLAGARYGALGVLDEGGGELSEFIVTGLDAEAQRRIGNHPTGKGVLGLLIAQPEPVRLPDIRLHPNSYGFPPNHPPMHSFLGVPVRVGGAVFGNLYLAEKVDAPEFTGGDEQVVVALAAAAGVAVEKARLYRDSRRREQWLEAANAITPALLAERGPDEVLDRIARHARAVTEGELSVVALPAHDGEGWVVKAASGADAPWAIGRRIDGTHPAVAEALKRPETMCHGDPGSRDRAGGAQFRGHARGAGRAGVGPAGPAARRRPRAVPRGRPACRDRVRQPGGARAGGGPRAGRPAPARPVRGTRPHRPRPARLGDPAAVRHRPADAGAARARGAAVRSSGSSASSSTTSTPRSATSGAPSSTCATRPSPAR